MVPDQFALKIADVRGAKLLIQVGRERRHIEIVPDAAKLVMICTPSGVRIPAAAG